MSEVARHSPSILPFISLVPILIAAAAQKAQRKIVTDLRQAGAIEPARAIALQPGRHLDRSTLERMVGRGTVRRAGPLYYLDEASEQACRDQRQRRLPWVLAILLAGLAVLVTLILLQARH
jgi:hypothetical protein